jgi:hypothetical protein
LAEARLAVRGCGDERLRGCGAVDLTQQHLGNCGFDHSTEGQHEGALRAACVMRGVKVPALDGHDHPPTSKLPFQVNPSTGLTPPCTTAQVLNIVYAGGRCSGGFFPNGMSGTIVCRP